MRMEALSTYIKSVVTSGYSFIISIATCATDGSWPGYWPCQPLSDAYCGLHSSPRAIFAPLNAGIKMVSCLIGPLWGPNTCRRKCMQMKSAPRYIILKGDLCIRQSNVCTGRMLANRPSFLRIASRPCSGRTLPPDYCHICIAHSSEQHGIGLHAYFKSLFRKGSPVRSMAWAPRSPRTPHHDRTCVPQRVSQPPCSISWSYAVTAKTAIFNLIFAIYFVQHLDGSLYSRLDLVGIKTTCPNSSLEAHVIMVCTNASVRPPGGIETV